MPVKKASTTEKTPVKKASKSTSSTKVSKVSVQEEAPTTSSSSSAVHIAGKMFNIEAAKQFTLRNIIEKNVTGKMDSYLKKITSKKDAQVVLDYKIEKNKHNRYDAKFRLVCDGKQYMYMTKTSFKFVEDIVNHAFAHFKLAMSEQK